MPMIDFGGIYPDKLYTLLQKKNDKNMYLIPTDIFSFIFKNDWNLHIQI